MEYYLAIKKKTSHFVIAWIDLVGIMLSEISQRKTNTMYFHSYVESKNQNKTQQKQTHRHRKQDGCQRGVEWKMGIK